MLIDFVRKINAEQNFSLDKDFQFIEFNDAVAAGITDLSTVPDPLDIIAVVKLKYEGTPPDSYKVLNLIIGDWVELHLDELTKVIHEKLKGHLNEFYPNSDISDMDGEDTAIWTDQLDYLPAVDSNDNSILIDIELVLHAESLEEEPK
jgi:hypothetical protein